MKEKLVKAMMTYDDAIDDDYRLKNVTIFWHKTGVKIRTCYLITIRLNYVIQITNLESRLLILNY